MTQIYHAHLYGTRDSKYDWLLNHDVQSTDWQELHPQAPFYLLIPQNTDLLGEYEQGWKITEVMPVNVLGFQSHRDHFAIDFDYNKLKHRISEMRDVNISDSDYCQKYTLKSTGSWQIEEARKIIRNDSEWERNLIQCAYRPFDNRPCYFGYVTMDRPRRELLDHVAGKENLCLNTIRQTKSPTWQHIIISSNPAPAVYVEIKDGSNIFPLYLYPVGEATPLEYRTEITQERRANFSPEFLKALTAKLGYSPTPEAIFYYIYAVFHSPTYRRRYAEFLKIDFPRVPLTASPALFQQLATYGEALVALHLLKSPKVEEFITQYTGNPDPVVDAGYPKYVPHPLTGGQDGSAPLARSGRGAGGEGGQVILAQQDGPHPLTPSPKGGEGGQDGSAPLARSGRGAGGEGGQVILAQQDGPHPLTGGQDGSAPLARSGRGAGGEGGQVILNKNGDRFTGVPDNVWNFYVGGYQVCHKWLKDRKGRTLSPEDLTHYQRIVVALQATIRLMQQIDAAIPRWPLE